MSIILCPLPYSNVSDQAPLPCEACPRYEQVFDCSRALLAKQNNPSKPRLCSGAIAPMGYDADVDRHHLLVCDGNLKAVVVRPCGFCLKLSRIASCLRVSRSCFLVILIVRWAFRVVFVVFGCFGVVV